MNETQLVVWGGLYLFGVAREWDRSGWLALAWPMYPVAMILIVLAAGCMYVHEGAEWLYGIHRSQRDA